MKYLIIAILTISPCFADYDADVKAQRQQQQLDEIQNRQQEMSDRLSKEARQEQWDADSARMRKLGGY